MPKSRPNVKPNTLGGRLTRLRLERGLSLRAVGKMVGASVQSISQWEQNVYRPREDRLEALANFFETSIDALTAKSSISEALPDVERLSEDMVTALQPSSRNHHQRLVVVKQIHEDDFTPKIEDLRTCPDIYHWKLPDHIIANTRNPADIRIMRVSQDAMAPTIQAGDHIIFDAGVRLIVGTRAFFLMVVDNHSTLIRRVEPITGKVDDHKEQQYRMVSENPALDARIVSARDVRVLGRVIGLIRLTV